MRHAINVKVRHEIATKAIDVPPQLASLTFQRPSNALGMKSYWELKKLLSLINQDLHFFLVPGGLSIFAAVCEALSMGLLAPLVQGMIDQNLSLRRAFRLFSGFELKLPWPPSSLMGSILYLSSIIVVISVLKQALQYAAVQLVNDRTRRIISVLQTRIFERYLTFGQAFLDRQGSGRLQGTLVQYTRDLGAVFPNCQRAMISATMVLSYLTVLLILSWRLALLSLVVFPIYFFILKAVTRKIRLSSNMISKQMSRGHQIVSDVLGCIPLIKASSMEKEEVEKFSNVSQTTAALAFSMDKRVSLIVHIQEVLRLIVFLCLVALTLSLFGVGRMTGASQLLVYFFVLQLGLTSINSFGNAWAQVSSLTGQISTLLELFDDSDKGFERGGVQKFSSVATEITFRNLSFSYRSGVEVLHGVSFDIRKGQITAIVGATGSGKTTLINLLQRFYDCPPETIFVDGVDIRQFSMASLREGMSVVSQNIHLFRDSIRNNLIYGIRKKLSDVDISEALRRVSLYEMVRSLPDGLETNIGDRGLSLSGGERQRLSIARAFLKDAHLLIFDEATSAIDTRTEKVIQQAMGDLTKNKTTIVIAHRLSTIHKADKIVLLEEGSFIEEGNFSELLARKGPFYDFYQTQVSL